MSTLIDTTFVTLDGVMQVVDTKVLTTGVVIATYEPAGAIVAGSFARD